MAVEKGRVTYSPSARLHFHNDTTTLTYAFMSRDPSAVAIMDPLHRGYVPTAPLMRSPVLQASPVVFVSTVSNFPGNT